MIINVSKQESADDDHEAIHFPSGQSYNCVHAEPTCWVPWLETSMLWVVEGKMLRGMTAWLYRKLHYFSCNRDHANTTTAFLQPLFNISRINKENRVLTAKCAK